MDVKLYSNPRLIDFLEVCYSIPSDERDQYEAFTGLKYDHEQAASRFFLAPGPSWVLVDGATPIAIAGFERLRPGVYQDWMFSTHTAWDAQHWRSTTKQTCRVMDAMLKGDAHRLQCVSLHSRIHAHRWYRVLGLRQEGVLEAYGVDGQDAIMFARLRAKS